MDSQPFRLTDENDQKAAMRSKAVSQEPTVRSDEESFLALSKFPQLSIDQALLRSTSDILDVVTPFNQPGYGPPRDVLIDKDLHFADSITTSDGMFSSSANAPA